MTIEQETEWGKCDSTWIYGVARSVRAADREQ